MVALDRDSVVVEDRLVGLASQGIPRFTSSSSIQQIFLHRPIQGFQILDQKVTLKFQSDLYSSRLVHEYIR